MYPLIDVRIISDYVERVARFCCIYGYRAKDFLAALSWIKLGSSFMLIALVAVVLSPIIVAVLNIRSQDLGGQSDTELYGLFAGLATAGAVFYISQRSATSHRRRLRAWKLHRCKQARELALADLEHSRPFKRFTIKQSSHAAHPK